ncbi:MULTISPECIES: ATP-binding cassette domain-containing protein [Rhizobium/Agrobacterium group]|uniref:ATP-binding cassette domain-containing protein n=2 Tax=Neorhizobium TaxID=1525371 RepID=A0ABV0LYS8_9HYPH|nr:MULTISPECIES: ATP-binding cassette domain-containing protein [Rhizobium/Agrobacterium group]KGD87433.1 thiamine ABC transporter ATP-binding protein [Rhizobium sp. YS-1r]MCC2612480.1 ATP-binding cassette domain-containing protein [Neorhizobium petrolearium]WGI67608.1 ATP-binding cassette domain-containing protein [Neorhizobium petrolearium]
MTDGVVLDKVELRLGTKDFRFNCSLPAGAVTAVTGPSGSGKSTLLNLVAGFETPDRGHVLVGGEDVTHEHPSGRPVSLIFQDNNLFTHLDLFTNIGLGINPSLRLSADDRRAISKALQRVGLDGFEKRMPGTLSGGERQRAAFARALVRKKPVLLMDEPFAALDPGLRLSMAKLLLELHREVGNTVLIVTHDPDEVGRLADHAIFIDHGQILLQAPTTEFLARRDIPALAEFLSG